MAAKKAAFKIKRPGAFTKKAKAAGMSTQAYARKVMAAPKGKYPARTRLQANFARNATKFAKPRKGSTKTRAAGRKAARTRRARRY